MKIEERVTVSCEDMRPLVLGNVRTNMKRITFDLAPMMEVYGKGGTVELWYRRPNDLAATKQNLQLYSTIAVWDITQENTGQRGEGEAQFLYTLPDGKGSVKTNVFPVLIIRDINT